MKRILIVENEQAARELMRAIMDILTEGTDYEFKIAEDVSDGAAMLFEEGAWDLVITDWDLGNGKTGKEIIATARASQRDTAKVVVLSSREPAEILELCDKNKPDEAVFKDVRRGMRQILTGLLEKYCPLRPQPVHA